MTFARLSRRASRLQPLQWAVVYVALGLLACNSKAKPSAPNPPQSAAAPATAAPAPAPAPAPVGDSHDGHVEHEGEGGEAPAKAATPSALSAEARGQLTMLLVSAHVGSVIARKESNGWVISGHDGCTVDAGRMKRAFDNLMALKVEPTQDAVPEGSDFRLQISALVGQKRVVHLEVADPGPKGHLTRLDDDSMVHLKGLDTRLWSAQPADWCRGP